MEVEDGANSVLQSSTNRWLRYGDLTLAALLPHPTLIHVDTPGQCNNRWVRVNGEFCEL